MKYFKKRKYINKKQNKYKYIYFKEYKNGKQIQIKKEEYYKKKQIGGVMVVQKGGQVNVQPQPVYVPPYRRFLKEKTFNQEDPLTDNRSFFIFEFTMGTKLKQYFFSHLTPSQYIKSSKISINKLLEIIFKLCTQFKYIDDRLDIQSFDSLYISFITHFGNLLYGNSTNYFKRKVLNSPIIELDISSKLKTFKFLREIQSEIKLPFLCYGSSKELVQYKRLFNTFNLEVSISSKLEHQYDRSKKVYWSFLFNMMKTIAFIKSDNPINAIFIHPIRGTNIDYISGSNKIDYPFKLRKEDVLKYKKYSSFLKKKAVNNFSKCILSLLFQNILPIFILLNVNLNDVNGVNYVFNSKEITVNYNLDIYLTKFRTKKILRVGIGENIYPISPISTYEWILLYTQSTFLFRDKNNLDMFLFTKEDIHLDNFEKMICLVLLDGDTYKEVIYTVPEELLEILGGVEKCKYFLSQRKFYLVGNFIDNLSLLNHTIDLSKLLFECLYQPDKLFEYFNYKYSLKEFDINLMIFFLDFDEVKELFLEYFKDQANEIKMFIIKNIQNSPIANNYGNPLNKYMQSMKI